MSSTGKSNTEVIAEAVSAIGPWLAWIGAKRVEVRGQIAQMQVSATVPPPHESALATRLRSIALPTTGRMPASEGDLPPDVTSSTVTADSAASAADMSSAVVPQSDPNAPADAADMSHVSRSATSAPEEPVRSQASSPSITALPTLQNQPEAQAYLETVFTATSPHTLLPRVVAAWEGRTADPEYNARMLIGAKEAGVLSADLAHAVRAMVAFDNEFAAAYALYEGGYKELFDIGLGGSGPTDDVADDVADEDTAEEEADDGDADEGDDEEAEEEERQWGFPGEDEHESPF